MAWIGSVFNFLAGAIYSQSPAPMTPGGSGPLLCDQYGRLIVVPSELNAPLGGGTTWADPLPGSPLAASRIVSNVPKSLYQLFGSNEGAAARWIMVFNLITVPANGAEPVFAIPAPAGTYFSLDLRRPRAFSVGIVWAASSTAGTLTLDSGALIRGNAEVA